MAEINYILCANCGSITLPMVSIMYNSDLGGLRPDKNAYVCFAKYNSNTNKWEKGCCYNSMNTFNSGIVDNVIANGTGDLLINK